jgi:hypothetical protein
MCWVGAVQLDARAAVGAGESEDSNGASARGLKGAGASVRCCACCEDVVDEENSSSGNNIRPENTKRANDIPPARLCSQAGLCTGEALAFHRFLQRQPPPSRYLASQQFRLVEAAAPLPPPMEGHRNDRIERRIARHGRGEGGSQGFGERGYALVFEEMEHLAKGTFVIAEGPRPIKLIQ